MTAPLIILGIETSCDETAAAVIRRYPDGAVEVLSNIVHTQAEEHAGYGGIVPELAARSHVELADSIVQKAISRSGIELAELDGVAATAGPGLIGGVMVGMMTAKAIAIAHNIPFLPVNHLEGHALSARLTEPVDFPYLLLLVSGGHTQLLSVAGVGDYRRLGTTIDDAVGEAFDKTAKLLGLGQPGGPMVETAALTGAADRFDFPRPLADRDSCDFSFSGLKTAVRVSAEKILPLTSQDKADLAASFQRAAARHLAAKTERAMAQTGHTRLVLAGGVASNRTIRTMFAELAEKEGWRLIIPEPKYCTDNGAMIALAGAEHMVLEGVPARQQSLHLGPRARWPLDDNPAGMRYGSGKKGPKA